MTTREIDSSKLRLLHSEGELAFYEYKPTLLRPLYFNFQKMWLSRRLRYLSEWLGKKHYLVYYLAIKGELVGHCIVAPGGRRLKSSTANDIVVGPYYIEPSHRGKKYSKDLLKLTLRYCSFKYDNAYDYIIKSNVPSIKVSEFCGFSKCGELNIIGRLRKIVEVPENGKYLMYKYERNPKNE